ncbi:Stealth CR1 domain-containing protein [Pontixanthobacter gangjinensis]|uniref:Stealth protein CR2 conserved region 2 domain-containing protein n=1 Tax=Pontixanthobacter gangjinensis TaxID=1028742 RepID=A0A6I4SQ05_9SPHN|nr:hypothetical protein [Pontixanthobacter gangjinensis]MXO57884.1 hypothetical protein [Pontixanthobacter gangjinensis]
MENADIVITWVDGSTPEMMEKRAHFLGAAEQPLHGNGINPHRWLCSDELGYCLRSIANHAPDIRRIWILTDGQTPELPDLPASLKAKISIADHRQIFAGYEEFLPTFNSLSIETFLWRIPGLAEHFLYFNDDVFLTAPVKFSDFFTQDGPVLRGKWADLSHLLGCEESRNDAALLNQYNQIASGRLAGFTADHLFESAHVVYPMQRSIMETLFAEHLEAFTANCAFRFRSTSQFLPQSLYTHHCLNHGLGRISELSDHLHIPANNDGDWSAEAIKQVLSNLAGPEIKLLCINDLPEIEGRLPNVRQWIERAITQ